MKRLDRVMYAFFLLALLADVARANVCVPVGGDAGDSAILSAANQFRIVPAGEDSLQLRRASKVAPSMAKLRSYAFRMSGWARILSPQVNPSDFAVLTAFAAGPGIGFGPVLSRPLEAASPSRGIFEHSGSPAP